MYQRGDVILVRFPYDDEDESKPRPALVLGTISDDAKTCKITKVNHTGRIPGRWVEKDSEDGKQMGLKLDSFVSTGDKFRVRTSVIIKKIGTCPFVDEIDPIK